MRPGTVPAGIVHLGLGAFHRAHQAVYTEEAIAAAGGDWGIVGGRAALAPTSSTRSPRRTTCSASPRCRPTAASTRVVGALAGVRHAAARPGAVVALLADPAIRVVTLTVTEKAYRLDPATGRLLDDPALRRRPGQRPAADHGARAAGPRAARPGRADAGPIALVSCDNLPANGRRLRGMVDAGARAGPAHADDWVRANVSFPAPWSTGSCRPATARTTLAAAAAALGRRRPGGGRRPSRTAQWVIEDDFPGGRPAWERGRRGAHRRRRRRGSG